MRKTAHAVPAITVFAAASTQDVLHEAVTRYEATTGIRVVCSFDASSNLARQIEAGSPADLFISADEQWMDDVQAQGAIDAATRQDLLANDLVFVAPIGSTVSITMSREFDVATQLPGRIALGDPSHVPAGIYARQALEHLGWWEALQPRLLPAKDVRAALRLVEIGEADFGIVYATDARISSKVAILATFPEDSHDPIHYPIAICTGAHGDEARAFIDFLRSDEMREVFEHAGFRVIPTSEHGS